MRNVIRTKFRGKTYRVAIEKRLKRPTLGISSAPWKHKRYRRIHVDESQTGKDLLEVLIHEALHACYWDLDEEAIDEAGVDIAQMLWKFGYRRRR